MIQPYLDPTRFKDRRDAAEQLVHALGRYRGQHPLVLGIPRGGVVLAEILARELEGDLDIVLVRKLRAPGRSEAAIGSITEQGIILMNEGTNGEAPEDYVRYEAREALGLMAWRRALYTPGEPPADPAGRVTIVVDDGIATGATMMAALHSLRESGATRIIAAAAVAPPKIVRLLRREADDVHCLARPDSFYAVSFHFEEFPEVTDEEIIDLLRHRSPKPAGRSR